VFETLIKSHRSWQPSGDPLAASKPKAGELVVACAPDLNAREVWPEAGFGLKQARFPSAGVIDGD
jgi:hypothetical protein